LCRHAASVIVGARVDKFSGDHLGRFDNFHPLWTVFTVWYYMYCTYQNIAVCTVPSTGTYRLHKKVVSSGMVDEARWSMMMAPGKVIKHMEMNGSEMTYTS
jgi:hypothetical protein